MSVRAPPTPPPTSSIEIEDQAKAEAAAAAAAAAASSEMSTDPAPPAAPAPVPGPSASSSSSSKSKAPERAPDDTVFRSAFAGISATVAQGQYADVVALAERADLVVSAEGDLCLDNRLLTICLPQGDSNSPARLLVIAPMVLAYLIVDDLCV